MDWGALVNMGSAGAVIAVVVIFLRSNKERDAEWRNFFTELNKANREDVAALSQALAETVRSLDSHDQRARQILDIVCKILALVEPKPTKNRLRPDGANHDNR